MEPSTIGTLLGFVIVLGLFVWSAWRPIMHGRRGGHPPPEGTANASNPPRGGSGAVPFMPEDVRRGPEVITCYACPHFTPESQVARQWAKASTARNASRLVLHPSHRAWCRHPKILPAVVEPFEAPCPEWCPRREDGKA